VSRSTATGSRLVRIGSERGILPEGIVWHAESNRLSWVDIELGRLHIAAFDGGTARLLQVLELGDQLGCALPSANGGWVCGLGRSLATVSPMGIVDATAPLLFESERFNDGHVDSDGRLVIGTLNSDGPDGRQLLIRLEHDGSVSVLDDRVGISNGIAWSPDGRWLYHADTAARTISRRAYGDEVGPAERFITVDGMPDGIAADSEGNLWVTIFDQGRVDCHDPTGRRVAERSLVLPDAHITSVGFGGPGLDVLFVATGMPVMRHWLRRRRGGDGWVYSGPAAPARGLAAHEWRPAALPSTIPR
jgi:sugar lactone lactonase YvrE